MKKRPTSRKSTSADRFHRVRADHSGEITEDYVELIADLIEERGEARGSDIAKRLGVSNATVVKTLKRLQESDLVAQEPYRAIFLTDAGRKLADEGRRRHTIVEDFLIALGVSAETARADSEGLEHHVSSETLDAMERFIRSRAS
ncbi:MAG: manganese-binding transcriptional regulator MntR [Parvibaculaceae bacterium]